MDNLKNLIEQTADAFYQEKDESGYEKLDAVICELMSLNEIKMLEKIKMAMAALEQRDTVLLADVLLYEIKPLINENYRR